jgi:hypothetical protein
MGSVGIALALFAPLVGVFVAPPLLSASVLIYARLLGRLGWRINLKR